MDKLKNWIQENNGKMDVEEPNAATWDRLKNNIAKSGENDPLKNHIAAHKNLLEIETPDTQSWDEVSRFFSAKQKAPVHYIKRSLHYLSAACIITAISLGVFHYMAVVGNNKQNGLAEKRPPANSSHITDIIKDTRISKSNNNDIAPNPPSPHRSFKQTKKRKSIAVTSSKPVKKQDKASLPPEVLQMQKDYAELIAGQINYTKSLAVYGESVDFFERFMNDFKLLDKQEKELRMEIIQHGLQENSIDNLAVIYKQKLTVLKKLQNEIAKTSMRNKNITDTVPVYIKL